MLDETDLENTDVLLGYMSQPLVWTSKGNMPVCDLRQVPLWKIEGNVIQFSLEYYDGEELVRKDVHNYAGGINA